MYIETPPMLSGNNRDDIARLRGYLYRVSEQLNHEESVPLPEATPEKAEKTQGIRKIFSSESGAAINTTFGIDADTADAKFYTVVFQSNTEANSFMPVMLFRRGNKAVGNATIGGKTGTVVLEFSGGTIKIKQGTFDGYTIKEVYATVI